MKNRILTILIICLAISTLVFSILWYNEKTNKDDLRLLAQSSASDAYSQFTEYQERGNDSSYWYGVAAFRSFQQAYYLLTENTNDVFNYTSCNIVYGVLVLAPDKCREYISEIAAVMEILKEDVENENGYIRMTELGNMLSYG